MHRLSFAVAVTLLSSATLAQEPTPADVLAQPWSVGTGYGLGGLGGQVALGSLLGGGSLGNTSAYVPYATVNVERRLTAKTSLICGLSGSLTSDGTPRENVTSTFPVTTAYATQSAAIGLGVRQQLSSGGGWVTLSGSAAVSFGYARLEQTLKYLSGADTVVANAVANGGRLGLQLGVAAERVLVEQLAVRLSLSLLDAGYSAGRSTSYDGSVSSPYSRLTVSLPLSPALELRLYF